MTKNNIEFAKDSRTYELDLIRFIAALCVVIYHYKTLLVENIDNSPIFTNTLYSITKFGYLGVDLFFIVSGFVIFSSALNRTCSQFVVSRFVRIYPTLWVCASATAASLYFFEDSYSISIMHYLANLTLFHTYIGIESIDGVYWTLVTEIKFYICIYLLIFFKVIEKYKIWLTIWLGLTILFFISHQPFFLGWFISPYYSPYFISGITFYLAKKNGYGVFHILTLSISLVLACIYAYDIIDDFSRNISQLDRIIAVLIVCIFYLIFYLISVDKISMKASKTLMLMGGMTYPLYLLHNLIGKAIFNFYSEYIQPIPLIFIVLAFVIFLSYMTHVYIELKYSNKIKLYLFNLLNKLS